MKKTRIGNVWTDTIYPREFGNRAGKFFNIVTEEDGSTQRRVRVPAGRSRNRIKLTLTFIYEDKRLGRPAVHQGTSPSRSSSAASATASPYWDGTALGPRRSQPGSAISRLNGLTAFLQLLDRA